jgi:response regulator of citrate/malate metabolism
MISGHANVQMAVDSLKLGAFEFIQKPFSSERLLNFTNRAIENVNLKRKNFSDKENYEHICFSCWDAFSLKGFAQMKEAGVTTLTTYPWMLYGVMNDAPLNEKIDAMDKFFNEFVCELR